MSDEIKRPFNSLPDNPNWQDDKFERMGRDTIATLVPTKSDKELAEEYKQRIEQAYQPLIAILDEMDKHGFTAQVAAGKNAFGRYQIVQLQLVKVF